jgi:SAM-dependent methyltransferase
MTIGPQRELHERNRASWNVATEAHNTHKGDQAKFFREGGSTLHSEERGLLGDISGTRLVHLQCNAGQDTLSLVKLGAEVVGVDISDSAIEFARQLSLDSGIPATFVRADVFDWLEQAIAGGEQFDVAFSSYGALIWLSDLKTWARGISSILKPGGRFVVVDFHPVPMMFDDDWNLRFPYSPFDETSHYVVWDDGVGDYVAIDMKQSDPESAIPGVAQFENPHPSYEFVWGIGDILTAFLEAGMLIRVVKEYPYSTSGHQPGMRPLPDGKWAGPEGFPPMPYMYGIVVEKP